MIVPMKKITFVGIESEKERFLERLQELGVVHLILPKEPVEPQDVARRLQRVIETKRFLSRKVPKEGPRERLDAEAICARREELGREENQLQAEIVAARKQRAAVEPWGDFSIEDVRELHSKGLHIQFFRVSRRALETLPLEGIFYQVIQERGGEVCFATFSPQPVDIGLAEERLPEKRLSEIDREIAKRQERLREIEEGYAVLAQHLDVLEKEEARLTDLLEYERALLNAHPELDSRIFVLQGWSPMPEEELAGRLGESFTFFHFSEEPAEEDRMPVLLKNPPAFDSGEDLVKIYSYPSHRDFDPSPFVLYCFAVFFGMIVGDTGYGLIMLAFTLWLHRRIRSRSSFAVRFFRLMFILCASVIFFGLISASLFGIRLDPNNPWVRHAWFDYSTMEGQNHIMVISVLIGMAHISLSMLIKCYKDRQYAGIGWVIAIWSAYFLINSHMAHGVDNPRARYGLILGLAMVFLFSSKSKNPLLRVAEGFQGLLGIVQVFSDILSYLRLFALGVATVYIAQTFNVLGGTVVDSVPVLGLVFAGVILLVGHALNIGLAIMGGVIHGLRLNFLEWYRWCFEGDGLPYKPFQRISEP